MHDGLSDALEWITELLAELEIPYQVVGGLAARAYGASRPVVDVDMYVPDMDALKRVTVAAGEHVTRLPEHHRDAHWDLTFLTVLRSGWRIEIAAGESAKVFDVGNSSWQPAGIRFDQSEERAVEGVLIQVMPLPQLLDYKEGVAREVDLLDIRMLRADAS
jgi:hypothetical protein